jgi:hypothetical protein
MDNLPFRNFPPQEIEAFNALCADCNLAADGFSIFAMCPEMVSSGIVKRARIIYVNYEPTGRQQQYLVIPEHPDWLGTFGTELRGGYYTGVPIEA